MKRILSLLVLFALVLSLPLYAQEIPYVQGAVEKGEIGIVNTFTGWLEIPVQAHKGYTKGTGEEGKNDLWGGVVGFFRGIYYGVGRTATGIFQLVTCVLPNRQDNQDIGIPLDSQYVWEEGTQYSFSKDGAAPMGNKFVRGLSDSVGCLLEYPGQLTKAANQTTLMGRVLDVCKAIFYPVARLASGAYDMVTFFLPNDTKTHGRPFDEVNAWDAINLYQQEVAEEPQEEAVDFFALNLNAP